MAKQVCWTKPIFDEFMELSMINKRIELGDEKANLLYKIMESRICGWTITKQSIEYHLSIDTVNRYVRELKDLYDQVQPMSKYMPSRHNLTTWEIQDQLNQ